jgi:two-component system chemotaxis response regulator CheY
MSVNVLVADDSAVMRAMMIRTLRLCGLQLGEVVEAGDGVAGLARLRDSDIQLVLVDVNMPEMDGLTMLARARAAGGAQRVAAVVVSSDGSDTRAESVRHGGDEFLQKPFTPEALRDAIHRALGATHAAQ